MLTFDEILTQVTDLVQQQGRVSYRLLKRRFALDDDYLERVAEFPGRSLPRKLTSCDAVSLFLSSGVFPSRPQRGAGA